MNIAHKFYLVWVGLKELAMSRQELALQAYKAGYDQALEDVTTGFDEIKAGRWLEENPVDAPR